MKQIKQDGLIYLINEKEEKSEIIGFYEDRNNFIIPRSINYESCEYIIITISENAFRGSRNIKSIQFSPNSELQTIESKAFSFSSIESIFIPPHVTKICGYAFFGCQKLQRIDIPLNSELQTIEERAFSSQSIESILIPPHVKTIGKEAFSNCYKLQRIDFPLDSELQTIEENAFIESSIESIFIPASVIDLKEGWCKNTYKLKMIDVDPRNSRYSNYEGKMIIYKTSETNENYDKIIFCRRDIKEITIPSFIKIIGSYSFSDCKQLQRIDIPSNSELQIIDNYAFSWTSIESIFIPTHVKKICREAFSFCQLLRIDIPLNSELQTIEKGAFVNSSIESIFIPASVIDLKEGWCKNTYKLKMIDVDPRNSRYSNYEGKMIIYKTSETSENYDKIIFCRRDIKEITIPSFIKIIGSYAFNCCEQLQRIDIPLNSELQIIDKYAFASSSIESIFIPPHIKKICKSAFSDCYHLQQFDISSNSELKTIDKYALINSSIESIFIPASVIDLNDGCLNIRRLKMVKVDPRNARYSYLNDKMIICKTLETSENYDKIVFARRDIKEATIPSFIKTIGSFTFYYCYQLLRINIAPNSELKTIDKRAFSYTSIKRIFIPPYVTKICEYAFSDCYQLLQIDIPPNSELQTIEDGVFSYSSIEKIFIPPHVTKICYHAFLGCKKLLRIDIPSNSELQAIDKYAFSFSSIESIFIPSHVTKISETAFIDCRKLHLIEIDEKSEIELYKISQIFPKSAIIMIPIK